MHAAKMNKAGSARPGRRADFGRVLHRFFEQHLQQIMHTAALVPLSADPELVHSMRVAVRRLRSVVQLTGHPDPQFLAEASWLSRKLGAVRDMDVQIQRLVTEDASAAVPGYRHHLQSKQKRRHKTLVRVLEHPRYHQWIESVAHTAELWQHRRLPMHKAGQAIYLSATDGGVKRRGRALPPRPKQPELHKLRIECKRLRYLLDLFSGANGDLHKECIEPLARLQNVLGELQDQRIHGEQLRRYAHSLAMKENNRGKLLGIGAALAELEHNTAREMKMFSRRWRQFDTHVTRKRVGRVLL